MRITRASHPLSKFFFLQGCSFFSSLSKTILPPTASAAASFPSSVERGRTKRTRGVSQIQAAAHFPNDPKRERRLLNRQRKTSVSWHAFSADVHTFAQAGRVPSESSGDGRAARLEALAQNTRKPATDASAWSRTNCFVSRRVRVCDVLADCTDEPPLRKEFCSLLGWRFLHAE